MNTITIPFQAHLVFTGKHSYDVLCEGNWKTHRQNITEALTEFSTRKGEALERGYLMGRYGGLPILGELQLEH